jgi:peptidoglycan/LPS O-acetylase OafA/YrhL
MDEADSTTSAERAHAYGAAGAPRAPAGTIEHGPGAGVASGVGGGLRSDVLDIAPEAIDAPALPVPEPAAAERDRTGSPRRRQRPAGPVRPRHFPCFDGLRAIAAISIVMVHTAFVSGFTSTSSGGIYTARLEIGVTVFFLISGFLLYRPFAASHIAGRAAPATGRFWMRRFLRIVPAYWVAFTIVSYVMRGDIHLLHGFSNDLVYYGFAQIYFPHVVLTGVTQAWSLNTEISFYLFLPIYATGLALGRARRSDAAQLLIELVGVATLIGISIGFRAFAFHQHTVEAHVMPLWLPAWLDMFGLGMLLAVVSSWLAHRDRRPRVLWHPLMPYASWALAGAAFWAVAHVDIPIAPIYPDHLGINLARQSLYGAFALFLLLPAVFGPQPRGLVRRFLACKPMVGLGLISYGIYLWHQGWILIYLQWAHRNLSFPFGLPWWQLFFGVLGLAAASAAGSYVLIERPILQMKDRIGWWTRRSAPLHAVAGP